MPRPLEFSKPEPVKRRDSESQLQSLVARIQCGDWPPVVTSLLKDRVKGAGPTSKEAESMLKEAESGPVPRSIYRETLFLTMTVSPGHVNIGMGNLGAPLPIWVVGVSKNFTREDPLTV